MGLWAWLTDQPRTTSTTIRIPVNKIDHGHSPDMRTENRGLTRNEGPPIHVRRRGSRYRVHDGNDRLGYARQAGRTHITAHVID